MADATQVIVQDHRKVEALFGRYEQGNADVVAQICTELQVHTAIEEQVVYPVLPEISGGQQLRIEAEHEHQEVKDAIARIEGSGPGSAEVSTAMEAIMQG